MINAQDAANLKNYDLTDFYIRDINDYVNKSETEADIEPQNKYLLCKRTTTVEELHRTPRAPQYCKEIWNLTDVTITSSPKSSPTILLKGRAKENFNEMISKWLRVYAQFEPLNLKVPKILAETLTRNNHS